MEMLIIIPNILWVVFAKWKWKREYHLIEIIAQMFIIIGVVYLTIELGKYSQTRDIEILNGEITWKDRRHDQYEESYSCNCKQVQSCSGSGSDRSCSSSEVCETCYRTHYTVDWLAFSTLGDFTIDHKDSLSPSVYMVEDPERYKEVKIGEACSTESAYTNFLQAVPESLPNFYKSNNSYEKYMESGKLPNYPRVYDIYRVNRVLNYVAPVEIANSYNKELSEQLKVLGSLKEVNVILVMIDTNDPDYRYALEKHWEGGNMNDVIVILGTTNYPKIQSASIITYAGNIGNELFTVKLRDELLTAKMDDVKIVSDVITNNIKTYFTRKDSFDYKHLENEIKPPLWGLFMVVILSIGANAALTYIFTRNNLGEN